MYLVIDSTYSASTGFEWDEYPILFEREEDAIQHVTDIMNGVEGESIRYIQEAVIPRMTSDDFEYHTYYAYLMKDDKGELLPIPNTDTLKPTITKEKKKAGCVQRYVTVYSIIIVRGFIARRTIEIYPVEVDKAE